MTKAVLLIDSQMATRRMHRFAMELLEYRVVELDNQAGVLAELSGSCPELLILGVNADDAGRQNLLSQLRQQPAFDALPVLLIGEDHLRSNWDLRAIGHCAWLNKPFRIGELHDQVATLMAPVFPPLGQGRAAFGGEHD
jgi:DNA-binding NtrC family response regulator